MNYEPIMFRCSVEGSFRTTRAGQAPPAPVALSGGRVARSRAGGAKAPRGAHAARVLKVEQNCVEADSGLRSEEHTSELQSLAYLVCRLLLEKKKRPRIESP